MKARGRKGGALGFRSEPRGELFVLLAGGARTAPVVNAAVTARVACEEQAEHTLWEEWRAARRGGGGEADGRAPGMLYFSRRLGRT